MCSVLCMPLHALLSAVPSQPLAQVYERLPEPPAPDDLSVWGNFEQASERLYMIGLNGRGQGVLRGLGVMERIDTASSIVVGRCGESKGTLNSPTWSPCFKCPIFTPSMHSIPHWHMYELHCDALFHPATHRVEPSPSLGCSCASSVVRHALCNSHTPPAVVSP
jgi:hypothetical protein